MDDPWHVLKRHTSARIALGRTGDALPTRHLLEFQAAHARARDSVHMEFDSGGLADRLRDIGKPLLALHSAAADRSLYLQRPDLGRRLAEGEAERLSPHKGNHDVAFVLADGLSARAVHDHAEDMLRATLAQLDATWVIAPVALVHQGRVAIADEIGDLLGAEMTVILIGERPGLSSADSLGAYLTWAPKPGRSNAERNCISNIRPDGLPPEAAAFKLAYLMRESRRQRLSGIKLKDDAPDLPPTVARPELEG